MLFDTDSHLVTAFQRQHIITPSLLVRSVHYSTRHCIGTPEHGVLHYAGWIYQFFNSDQPAIEQALLAAPDALDHAVETVQLSLDNLKSRRV